MRGSSPRMTKYEFVTTPALRRIASRCAASGERNNESHLMDAIYRITGNRAETSPNAAGPWDATMQHGSAPAAPMQIVRVTIDLMRPVPVAPLTIETEVLREGRKIQLCAVRLLANDVVVVRAAVLKVRADSLPLPSDIADAAIDVPSPDRGTPM